MKCTTFYSVKGGAGCSTTAAMFSLMAAEQTEHVALKSRQPEDTCAILGVPTPVSEGASREVGNGLFVTPWDFPAEGQVIVYDYGLNPDPDDMPDDRVFMVLRADYLSLRHALDSSVDATGIVLVTEPDRSLQKADVEDVVGRRVVAEVPYVSTIATAVDAGLLARRLPTKAKGLAVLFDGLDI